jgi:hypothetical protein
VRLAGRTPFDTKELMSQGIDTMRKMIREKQPVRPSTKLATLNQTGDYVNALRFLPDGNTLVSVSKSSLHLWRVPLLKQIDAGTKPGPGENEAY